MARGAVCFNRGVRRAAVARDPVVLHVFTLAVAVQLLVLPGLDHAGVAPLQANLDAGAPRLLPAAQVVGGAVFGAGMALAGGCMTGVLWKAGAGSIATAIAVAGFAIGELVARGALRPLLDSLDDLARPSQGTLHGVLGVGYAPAALVLGGVALALLLRRRPAERTVATGVGLGGLAALAWLAAEAAGHGYGLGFTGAADATRNAIAAGAWDTLPLALFVALGLLAGAAVATRGPLRVPDAARAGRGLAGGVLMGIGANAAHGCNIGHGLTGVALLSLGSLLATLAMAGSAVLTWRLLLAPQPALRGVERPEPAGW
jgi:hypothetical protein